jgi:transposase
MVRSNSDKILKMREAVCMTEPLSVTTERVDDIPLVLAHSDKMGVPELLDNYFKPHGNWEGMSLGWTTAIWLTHILSEGDHRMNQVQGWAAHRVETLSICTGQQVTEQSFRDDRLALVLDALSQEQKWQQFETALNRQLIRVYDLKPKRVRVDSTTVSGYWTVTHEGLFQLGYSKDHRPTAEALLGAFQGIHLSIVTLGPQLHRHLTPLSALQQHILSLLDFSPDLYDQLLC